MRRLWQEIGIHRKAANIFLLVWLAAWAVTVTTWLYDSNGYSASMHPIATPSHFVLPLVAGILAGWWGKAHTGEHAGIFAIVGGGALAGVTFAAANFAVLLVFAVFQFLLGNVQPIPDQTWWDGVGEALGMGLAYCIFGLVLGAFGGLIGGIMPRVERRKAG